MRFHSRRRRTGGQTKAVRFVAAARNPRGAAAPPGAAAGLHHRLVREREGVALPAGESRGGGGRRGSRGALTVPPPPQDPAQLELRLKPMADRDRDQLRHLAKLYSLNLRHGDDLAAPILTKTR